MPPPSDRTAWDFMPPGFRREGDRNVAPRGFAPVTQLEYARVGIVTAEMQRVAEREPHLTAEQIRDDLVRHIDVNDELLVAKLSGEAAWYGFPPNGGQWLQQQLAA